IILEKVAFQSISDFNSVVELLNKRNIKAWVNCTRRMYPIYKEIKKKLKSQERISFHVDGKNWNMGCNSIHYIDLFAYLTGTTSISLDESGMDQQIYKSKRDGFVEFGGYLTGRSARGDSISLVDYKAKEGVAICLHIVCDKYEFLIREPDKLILEFNKETGWQMEKSALTVPFQSELTYLAVQQILYEGDCDLTPLKASYALHRPMLEAFNRVIELTGKQINGICPIT
ncbi:MAG: hypothetical protein KKH99_04055, partial [Proteobacteria bacterium]|nr:hypothetical protein [Pseudomonadota bacterium]